MYVQGNPKTKKELRRLVSIGEGKMPRIFSPGFFPAPQNGRATVEGPHYPKPHRWYASVELLNGRIVKVY